MTARAKFLLVAGCMLVLQTLDGFITTAVVSSGWARETNPLLISMADQSWFWGAKLLIAAVVLGYLYWRINGEDRHYLRATKWLSVASVVYLGIVLWNSYCLHVLRTMGVFS